MSQSVLSAPPRTREGRPPRAVVVLFAVLLLSLAGRLAFTLWVPPFEGTIRFDDVRALGNAYWPMNLYLDGPSYAVSFVATAVFLVLLGHGNGSALTLVGGLLVGLGGIVFSLVITAEALPFAYAANPDVLSEAEGRTLVNTLNAHHDLLLPAILGTMLTIALGIVLGLIGILLGGTTPRWFPLSALSLVVLSQVLPAAGLGGVGVIVGYVLELLVLAGIGWFALVRTRTEQVLAD